MVRRESPGPPYLLVAGIGLVTAEFVLLALSPLVGLLLHGALLVLCVGQFALSRTPSLEAVVVGLLPMVRLVSLAIPIDAQDALLTSTLAGLPLLIAAVVVAREAMPEVLASVLRRPASVWTQLRLAALGLPVGLLMLQSGAGESRLVADNPILGPIVICVFVVLHEELLFRGLIQHVTAMRSPVLSLFLPSALYAVMYLGSGSAATVAAMASIGLVFSFSVMRTGSLWGVIAAHAVGRILAGLG